MFIHIEPAFPQGVSPGLPGGGSVHENVLYKNNPQIK